MKQLITQLGRIIIVVVLCASVAAVVQAAAPPGGPALSLPATLLDCPDEEYEDANDSLAGAPVIAEGNTYAYICPQGDKDYSKFWVERGRQITLEMDDMPGAYDLVLYDINRERRYSLVGTELVKRYLTFSDPSIAAGYWYALVYEEIGNDWSEYHYELSLTLGPLLDVGMQLVQPDGGTATVGQPVRFQITLRNSGPTTITTLPLVDSFDDACLAYEGASPPPDNADLGQHRLLWYNLGPLGPGASKTVAVSFAARAPCESALNRAGNTQNAVDEYGTHVPERLADATVRIVAAPTATPTPTATAPACPTEHEPNGTFEEAAIISPGSEVLSYICPADDLDTFQFYAQNGQQIHAHLYHMTYNADLELFSPSETSKGLSDHVGTADEELEITADQTGQFYARVFGTEGGQVNPYNLLVTVSGQPVPTATPTAEPTPMYPGCPDGFEPNNLCGKDYPTWELTESGWWSYICVPTDADYWRLPSVGSGQTIEVALTRKNADYGVRLLDPLCHIIKESDDAQEDTVRVLHTANAAGTWYVQVFSPSANFSQSHGYHIAGVVHSCARDRLEDNDNESKATDLGHPVTVRSEASLNICPPGEQDWFRVLPGAGYGLLATLTHDADQGPLEMCLYDPYTQANLQCTNPSLPGLNRIDHVFPDWGARYLVVQAATPGGANPNYSISVQLVPPSGDLRITAVEPVQVVALGPATKSPLVREKATAFQVTVLSTFPEAVTAWLRLELPPGQWTDPTLMVPMTGSGAARPDTYPQDWGPYTIPSGPSTLWLPHVPAGSEGSTRDANNPAGILAGGCWGNAYEQCTIDTRYTPRPVAAVVGFTVSVDSTALVKETDETNNRYSQQDWPTIATRPWRFYFLPKELNGTIPSRATVGIGAKNLMEYLVGTYPIAESKVSYSVGYGSIAAQPGEDRSKFLGRLLAMAQSEGFDYGVASDQPNCGGGGTLFGVYGAGLGGACSYARDPNVMVLAHEFLHSTLKVPDIYSLDALVWWNEAYCEYTSGGSTQRQYCSWSNTGTHGTTGPFCVQPDRFTPPSCSGTITKTLLVDCHCSHDYADDPSRRWPCTEEPPLWTTKEECRKDCRAACDALGGTLYGGPDSRTQHPAAPGIWVNKWVPVDSGLNYLMDSKMGSSYPYFWQTASSGMYHPTGQSLNDGWANLLRSTVFLRATDPKVLLVRGSVGASGEGAFGPFLLLPQGFVDREPGDEGAYRLRLLGEGGEPLSETGFDVSFSQPDPYGGVVSEVPFSYRVEWLPETRRVELWGEGWLLASRAVSPNAPVLSLDEPESGPYRPGTPVTVTWVAGDADGDPLAFAISLSPDDGETWLPLAIDLAGDRYVLVTDDLPAGTTYRVKVRASDGINTTEAISVRPFAVLEVHYLPLAVRR